MAKRSSAKEAFWDSVLREFEGSGLSIREFCRRRDVSEQSFYSWRRRLARRPTTPSLIRVDVVDPEFGSGSGRMEIRRLGWALRFDDSVSASRLQEVLGVLVELCEE